MTASRDFRMRLLPQSFGGLKGVDLEVLPPDHFIAGLMQLPMVATTERDGEFVTHLETDRSRLCIAEVMRIGRLPSADAGCGP